MLKKVSTMYSNPPIQYSSSPYKTAPSILIGTSWLNINLCLPPFYTLHLWSHNTSSFPIISF